MTEPLLWILLGVLGTILGMGVLHRIQRWYRQRRYGLPIAHEELLVAYGHQMAGLLEREAVGRMLAKDVPASLDVAQSVLLLPQGHDLVATNGSELQLPIHHAAVRLAAAGGEAVCVTGRLRELIAQGRLDLSWTAVWAPLMRGTDLYGIWLLGNRANGVAFAPEDLRWLTTLSRQAAIVLETIRYAVQEQQLANEMQALYRRTVATRESERNRLSRELHDGVLQDMCAVTRDLKALATQSEISATFSPLIANSSEAVSALRAICQNLRPPLLPNHLPSALKTLVERLDANSPTPISIEVPSDLTHLPEETALALYRIVQEALNNGIQHADASEIAVRLTPYPDRLRLTVTDDGRGIPGGINSSRFVAQGHLGLAGMRERAAMIGGRLEVQTAVDYGTVVILEIPSSL
ncbi:MAG: GAF domain-containing sensor histidine kinase [Chloroflexi bacterium]|nr:GAF domain-containing sensor histidine kinase [Chloroflexota bacterium]